MCELGCTTDGIFYYYTSPVKAEIIKKTGVIHQGKNRTILNQMQPDQFSSDEILKNNYGEEMIGHCKNKADFVVLVTKGHLDYRRLDQKNQGDRHFFYYYDDILNISESQVFRKPRCVHSSNSIEPSVSENPPRQNDIIVQLRRDQSIEDAENKTYQHGNVAIFAPKWVQTGLDILRKDIKFPKRCTQIDHRCKEKSFEIHDITLKTLQQIARNEKWNTNGIIDFQLFGDLEQSIVLSLKDLVRQTVIVGTDRTTHYGGLRNSSRTHQNTQVYICDLIALQFQQLYNTGRLVLIGENLPEGKLDDLIYERVTGESKPSYEEAKGNENGRFIESDGCFFDSEAYIKFVAKDVVLSGLALDRIAKEKITFKFVKYGCGFYAGKFSAITSRLISQGVADGLKMLLPKRKNISSIELIFFERDEEIVKICDKYKVEVKFSSDDPLKKNSSFWNFVSHAIATTNCADNHACMGNPMGFSSLDGAIAENVSLKGFNFCPNINQSMKEGFLDL